MAVYNIDTKSIIVGDLKAECANKGLGPSVGVVI
jgi:hypothetical protein